MQLLFQDICNESGGSPKKRTVITYKREKKKMSRACLKLLMLTFMHAQYTILVCVYDSSNNMFTRNGYCILSTYIKLERDRETEREREKEKNRTRLHAIFRIHYINLSTSKSEAFIILWNTSLASYSSAAAAVSCLARSERIASLICTTS